MDKEGYFGRRYFLRAAAMGPALGSLARITPQSLRSESELPSFGGATDWLNSRALTARELRGKVVVVNFWTYTCINWLRSFPYLHAQSHKYGQQGLVVIGVHTPEFHFEHEKGNVRQAANARGIRYPIAIDNDYSVWNAFDNEYWPALYVADARGRIRHQQFGEGGYNASESVIRRLLSEANASQSRAKSRM